LYDLFNFVSYVPTYSIVISGKQPGKVVESSCRGISRENIQELSGRDRENRAVVWARIKKKKIYSHTIIGKFVEGGARVNYHYRLIAS